MKITDIMLFGEAIGGGGGSAVDVGYYIGWDGNVDGRDVIDLSFVSDTPSLYKVSSAVLTAEQMNEATFEFAKLPKVLSLLLHI